MGTDVDKATKTSGQEIDRIRSRLSDVLLIALGIIGCVFPLGHISWHSHHLPSSHGHGSSLKNKLDAFRQGGRKSRIGSRLDGHREGKKVDKLVEDQIETQIETLVKKQVEEQIKNQVEKSSKKSTEKPAGKPKQNEATVEKQVDKQTEKPKEKTIEKPKQNEATTTTQAEKKFEKHDEKQAEQKFEKQVEKQAEQKFEIPAKIEFERQQEKNTKKKVEPTEIAAKGFTGEQNGTRPKPKSLFPLSARATNHPVSDLDCTDHGGPLPPSASVDEMVFWSDIPSDASYKSPMLDESTERFLTFEPDHGGWNNIRMAMETALVMSHATGRTLVLPPEQKMYLIDKGSTHKTVFGFNDFFHLDAIAVEHEGFRVITMEEFLVTQGLTAKLHEYPTRRVLFPPDNRTNWNEAKRDDRGPLWKYLRKVGYTPLWDPWDCVLAIPKSTDPNDAAQLNRTLTSIMDGTYGKPKPTLEEFNGNPTPVNASMPERMREMLADREQLCIYNQTLQQAPLIHLKVEKDVRLLTHFYAFIFYADWKQDLWSKRFVRDHLRYVDEIMCAAARVIDEVRTHARVHDPTSGGTYDAMHVRRGDFQFPPTQLPADELYDLSKGELTENATLYVATDERDKKFFDPFRKHYDVVFLDDFKHVIKDINVNYYGMIDQLVAYKSRVFYGTWWSTLSGYVNRMRGYYIAKHKLEGYENGTMKSWYFTPKERVLQMRQYIPVRKPLYMREFPTSWRDIDQGIKEIAGNS